MEGQENYHNAAQGEPSAGGAETHTGKKQDLLVDLLRQTLYVIVDISVPIAVGWIASKLGVAIRHRRGTSPRP